jgi:hypothetical protein
MSSPFKERILEWVISAEDWSWEKLNSSDKMSMEFYGSRTALWYQRKARSPFHRSVSYHRQVWANVLQVELPSRLSGVHNMFHISQLKRCLKPPANVVIENTIPLEPDLTYKAYPTKILDQKDRVTRNKTTPVLSSGATTSLGRPMPPAGRVGPPFSSYHVAPSGVAPPPLLLPRRDSI